MTSRLFFSLVKNNDGARALMLVTRHAERARMGR